MKRIGVFVVLCALGLTGCAGSAPASKTPVVQKVSYLQGKSVKQVKRTMGKPEIIRTESPNQMWSYYKNGCTTLVFFNADGVVGHAESRGVCSRSFAGLFQ